MESKKTKTELAPLILGILATFPGIFLGFIGLVLGILAIIFGAIQFKKSKDGYAKVGLVLGIISIVLNIVLSIALSGFLYYLITDVRDIASEDYDDALQQCLSKNLYLQRTFCLGSIIDNNLNHPDVQSGKICSLLSTDEEKIFCVLYLSEKTSDRKYCDILASDTNKKLCTAIVTKDRSLCNELPLDLKIKCLDKIS